LENTKLYTVPVCPLNEVIERQLLVSYNLITESLPAVANNFPFRLNEMALSGSN
jgi:hypothetical protein